MRRLVLLGFLLISACTRSERPTPPPAHAAPALPAKMIESKEPASAPAPAEAAPAAEPPYDLAADRDRRVKAAKEEMGGRTSSAVVHDVFVVVGPSGALYDQSVALFRSAMQGYLNHRFDKAPAQAISVYLFPNAATYEQFCTKKYNAPCIAHFGFYEPGNRYMVMNIGLGVGTLTHEIVHPLVESDFPSAPTWLNEGIASVFEQPQIPRPGEIHGGKNWRWPRLKKALTTPSEKDKARLEHYFGMKDETFRGDDEDLNYAAARYICQWMDAKGKLWDFYHRWRDDVATDPTGEKSFKEVMGMTPAEATPQWQKWALAL
jgi:hypothetical protein